MGHNIHFKGVIWKVILKLSLLLLLIWRTVSFLVKLCLFRQVRNSIPLNFCSVKEGLSNSVDFNQTAPEVKPEKQSKQGLHCLHRNQFQVFSLAVFKENVEVLSKPWHRQRQRRAKTLTFSNISVITEDIYLKLRIVVHYQKVNPYH